jgi:hypothetical protein
VIVMPAMISSMEFFTKSGIFVLESGGSSFVVILSYLPTKCH